MGTSKTVEMIETSGCLISPYCWGIHYELSQGSSVMLGHLSSAYRPTISDRLLYEGSRNFEGLLTLSWQSLPVLSLYVMLVRFVQYIVSSGGKDNFLPKWLALSK